MHISRLLALIVLCLAPMTAAAQEFDGTSPVLCASIDTLSCGPGEECVRSTAEDLNVPQFFHIDFVEKVVSATRAGGEERTTDIHSLQQNDAELLLQGHQGGLGWSAAISRTSGKMALSAVGESVAFVIFGACTPL